MTALEHALADQGLEVLGQLGRQGEEGAASTGRLRVSTEPISSMGNGCDVLASVDPAVFEGNQFGLQPGSVLLHEAQSFSKRLAETIPEGVIPYRIPFSDLHRQCGGDPSGKGLVAVGVLAHLLGLAGEAVRRRVGSAADLRCFDAGFRFASTQLTKRDICALPPPPPGRRRMMLDARQALALGLTIGSCTCESACATALDRAPDQWLVEHLSDAWKEVASLTDQGTPSPHAYRGPDGDVTALLGAADPTDVGGEDTGSRPVVLVAADLLDAVNLASAARRLGRKGSAPVWVVMDAALANRRQSVPADQLVTIVREAERNGRAEQPVAAPSAESSLQAARDGDAGADVGFVAWGTAQGVVREVVALCRRFGLNVAALYPKMVRPAPVPDLESFAATVKRVVVVEPTRSGRYTELVRSWTSVDCSTLMPEPGQALTPMDIFLREGLGA